MKEISESENSPSFIILLCKKKVSRECDNLMQTGKKISQETSNEDHL